MSKLIALALTSVLFAGTAFAQAPTPPAQPSQPSPNSPAPAPSSGATAEVKAAKGVENREPVEPGTTFEAGTTVWAWSLINGAAGTTVKHVWKKDGKEVWFATLKVGSKKWTTYSRRKLTKAGSYSVEVVGEDGAVLGSTDITVQ
jgi:hypothetical protein